jgi:hypothetical protein
MLFPNLLKRKASLYYWEAFLPQHPGTIITPSEGGALRPRLAHRLFLSTLTGTATVPVGDSRRSFS